MKLLLRNQRRLGQSRAAMTLVELLFSIGIGAAVTGGLMILFVEVVKESRRSLAEGVLQQEAGLLQDRISTVLRSMSVDQSVIYTQPSATGSPFFRRIVIARGPFPAFAREELYFDAAAKRLVHDPNRASTGGEANLFNSSPAVSLRDLRFFTSLKAGGIPDSSAVNIWMELDDNGSSGQHRGGALKTNRIVRSFTVKMRNP